MAGLTPYKAGQGYWTRMFSLIGFGAVIAYTAMWVYRESASWFGDVVNASQLGLYQGAGAGIVLLLGGVLLYWLLYVKPRTSEFLIATEGEMRKVNWSTRKEVIGSTWVVIAISAIIAAILLVTDIVFSWFFTLVGVLEGTSG
ncbi:MAG: hypothetical protein Tsb0013_13150 [Phycisphaerales bacterium]